MKVIVAKSAGFCWGVKRAVEKARSLAGESGGPVFTDGPLVHNRQMMKILEKEGIHSTADPWKLRKQKLLIRAHGISSERHEWLQSMDLELFDCTCPDVAKIQRIIEKYSRQGYRMLIFGDRNHAEVVGLVGHSGGEVSVIESPDDVSSLEEGAPVCLVAQSTQLPAAYASVAEAVKKRFPGAIVIDTVCKSTKRRQQETADMAKEVDAIIVVGGADSANTHRLVELASSLKPTFHIETAAEIDGSLLAKFAVIGVTAGASTPRDVIDMVVSRLEALPGPVNP